MNTTFDYRFIVKELEENGFVFHHLLHNKTAEEYLWKQQPDKWCLLEIVCHLYDEEREDFRARVKHALKTPTEPLISIDPQGWVLSRNYIHENYQQKVQQFLIERQQSVKWLLSLVNPDWNSAYVHPKFGRMSAKMFLENWLVHDYLHIRQILKLKVDYLKHFTSEDLGYAGNW